MSSEFRPRKGNWLPLSGGNYEGTVTIIGTTTSGQWLCPDSLSIRNIGAADGWRGRVVRVFFRVLKWVTGV